MDQKLLASLREVFPNAQIVGTNLSPAELRALQADECAGASARTATRESAAASGAPSLDIWTHKRPSHGCYVELHVSEFQPGYAEATALVRPEGFVPPKPGRKRKAVERVARAEMSDDDIERSARRARKAVRHRIKQLNADRILTLTSRRYMRDQSLCFAVLREFNFLCRKKWKDWAYVAVPELHPKGRDHWHLHLAIRGYRDANILRSFWRQALRKICRESVGDHTPGNIDIRKASAPKHSLNALARYLSKYLTKSAADGWMFAKRYSCAGSFAPVKRTVVYSDYISDLQIIRKVQAITGAALSRNPRWDVFGGFDCLMIEMEPISVAPPADRTP